MNTPVYLDNNASTPVDPQVIKEMLPVLEKHHGNPSSSTHPFGWYAAELVEIARERVASLVGANKEEIIFTSGATESNNTALRGLVKGITKSDILPRLLSATTEHKAVLDPLSDLKAEGCKVELLDVDEQGEIDKEDFDKALAEGVDAVSLMLGNNEIGNLHDIESLAKEAKKSGIAFHCDATQALGKVPIDVKKLGIGLLSLSSHKVYGPKGVGALYVEKKTKPLLKPIISGGGHEAGLRAGTLNVPAIVGFGMACSLAKNFLERDEKKLRELSDLFLNKLSQSKHPFFLNGPKENRLPGNLNFGFEGVKSDQLIAKIFTKVALSSSSACSSGNKEGSHVLKALGLPKNKILSSLRVGLGRFNTQEEVEFACELLLKAVDEIKAS